MGKKSNLVYSWLNYLTINEGKCLVKKFEFGGSFGMSWKEDWLEVEVNPNLELLVTFDMSPEGVCHELHIKFHYKLMPNLGDPKFLPSWV
jgi:hypothetical protein